VESAERGIRGLVTPVTRFVDLYRVKAIAFGLRHEAPGQLGKKDN
jgi:hypothetical protein